MGINITEIIVVFVVALLLFGPEQLPALARQVGRITGELRKGSNALRREFYNTVYPPDITSEVRSGMRSLSSLKAEVLAPPVGSAPAPSARAVAHAANGSTATTAPSEQTTTVTATGRTESNEG